MLENKKVSECVIQFIDIIIDLYSPIQSEVRNQMRILQTTLLHGKNNDLDEHIASLQQKLRLKERKKMNVKSHSNVNLFSHDLQKQNKQSLGNRYRNNTDQSFTQQKCQEQLKSFATYSVPNLKIQTKIKQQVSYDGPQQKHKTNCTNNYKQLEKKMSNKTLLRLKKNKSAKYPLTARTQKNSYSNHNTFLEASQQLLGIMNSNDLELNKLGMIEAQEINLLDHDKAILSQNNSDYRKYVINC